MRPSAGQPSLIGLLVDVSGSMMTSIDNASEHEGSSRLESLRDSLDDLVKRGAEFSRDPSTGKLEARMKLFAYGFGFGGPLSFLVGSSGPAVRDLLDLGDGSSSTIAIDQLADGWATYRAHIERLSREMLGSTPMLEGMEKAKWRIERERQEQTYAEQPILFLLSDGEPDHGTQEIIELAGALRNDGVLLVSCLLTDSDLVERRHLYGDPSPSWPASARLMFDCASPMPDPSPFADYLREYRWVTDGGARLFTQVNQSEMLSEFLEVVLSPLRGDGAQRGPLSPRRS